MSWARNKKKNSQNSIQPSHSDLKTQQPVTHVKQDRFSYNDEEGDDHFELPSNSNHISNIDNDDEELVDGIPARGQVSILRLRKSKRIFSEVKDVCIIFDSELIPKYEFTQDMFSVNKVSDNVRVNDYVVRVKVSNQLYIWEVDEARMVLEKERMKEEESIEKSKKGHKRRRLDVPLLLNPEHGLDKLHRLLPLVKFKTAEKNGKVSDATVIHDLDKLMEAYREWSLGLPIPMHHSLILQRIEKLGKQSDLLQYIVDKRKKLSYDVSQATAMLSNMYQEYNENNVESVSGKNNNGYDDDNDDLNDVVYDQTKKDTSSVKGQDDYDQSATIRNMAFETMMAFDNDDNDDYDDFNAPYIANTHTEDDYVTQSQYKLDNDHGEHKTGAKNEIINNSTQDDHD